MSSVKSDIPSELDFYFLPLAFQLLHAVSKLPPILGVSGIC